MSCRHPSILSTATATLVLVDLQEPFLKRVEERGRVVDRCAFLASSAAILNLPVLTTLQYAERMGPVVPEIADALATQEPGAGSFDKMSFSCAGSEPFLERLRGMGRGQVLLAGVETHICVAQTALDLIHRGYQVHVAADAVSARGMDRHKLGMEKMRDSGVIPCSAEQAVFELLKESGTPQFKQILKLVK